jgi:hypothetical protein
VRGGGSVRLRTDNDDTEPSLSASGPLIRCLLLDAGRLPNPVR